MKTRVTELIAMGDHLFEQRAPLLSRWQDFAENFYPERADFLMQRTINSDFAGHLMTGVPVLARRDLGNAFHAMLRPRGQEWFSIKTADEGINEDQGAKRWMEWASNVMRGFMYEKTSHFVRATKEGDHDFATFGQCVISVEPVREQASLLYRNWHLRDVVWSENARLEIDNVHRKQMMPARNIVRQWDKTVSQKVREIADKTPFRELPLRHIMVPAEEYDIPRRQGFDYVSLWIDCEHKEILEEVPARRLIYVIPRWQTVSGSQYAHSPATVIAIPDSRLLQQITLTLLEAGQKAVDPPMVALGEVINGGVNAFAGGITWVDAAYDGKMGEILRPLGVDKSGLQFGIDREQRVTEFIQKAFYLDTLRLPELGAEKMTATETRVRMEEYMSRALPLFEPMESEYNGALCNLTFDTLMDNNAFAAGEMPQQLSNQEIRWQFESPLQEAKKRADSKAFVDSMQLLTMAAQLDQGVMGVFDIEKGFRDAATGAGAPATWIRTDEEIDAVRQAAAQKQQMDQAAEMIGGAGAVAEQVGKGAEALAKGGMPIDQMMPGMAQ